jgi:vacuolar-type H+-ATPase subunit C/Vma6
MDSVVRVDLDFLVARLHGQRQTFAEGDRLDVLSRLRSVPELSRAVLPNSRCTTAYELQHQLIERVIQELGEFSQQLSGAASRLLEWQRMRFQMENLKVAARAFVTQQHLDTVRDHLIPLPPALHLDVAALLAADSIESFAAEVTEPIWRQGLLEGAKVGGPDLKPVVLEAALDRSYFCELLQRTRSLPWQARHDSLAIARQETDTFHLMLVARGRFTYGLPPEQLAEFHITGASLSLQRFQRMLSAKTLRLAAGEAVGLAVEKLPEPDPTDTDRGQHLDPAVLETLAWNRYLRLARRAFRRNHMALGAVIAFTAIRRIELANLISLSEGIRMQMDPETIRHQLIPIELETLRV